MVEFSSSAYLTDVKLSRFEWIPESGDYEIDADDTNAEERLRTRRPAGVFFGLRIGYTSAYTLSGRMIEEEP